MKSIFVAVLFFFFFSSPAFADGNTTELPILDNPLQTSVNQIASALNNHIIKIPGIFDIWQHDLFWTFVSTILGAIAGFLLVIFVEKIKTPSAKIELFPTLTLPDGRKFLKVKIIISTNKIIKTIFPWQNPVQSGRIRGQFIHISNGQEIINGNFIAKWDAKPEPWDYSTGRPRLELLPAASEPQSFLSNDSDSAAVLVKHPHDAHFYIYDPNYYFNPQGNRRNEKQTILRLIFSSSSTTATKDFLVRNRTMKAFRLEELH